MSNAFFLISQIAFDYIYLKKNDIHLARELTIATSRASPVELGKTPALPSCAEEAREVAIDELDWTWGMLADLGQ